MIIENPMNRPPKVVFRPIWRCPLCGRIMIFEKGVNKWCDYFVKRRTICFDCDKHRLYMMAHKTEMENKE